MEESFMIRIFPYEELRKVMTGRGEDYTTRSLLDYDYWKNNYQLICCDLTLFSLGILGVLWPGGEDFLPPI